MLQYATVGDRTGPGCQSCKSAAQITNVAVSMGGFTVQTWRRQR
jgi:hypothetical protein